MSFLELSLKLKGFPMEKAVKEIHRLNTLSHEEFKEWQNEKKWEAVNYHLKNNQFYKNKLNNSLPPEWEEIPILNKKIFRSHSTI
ncbi:MAG: hypothetical protein IPM96_11080 [Ignavibacteria bacterium]|nr:hypothetical protein [Ignavibacteria bacterium]